ncbi:MAG: regulatory protein [Gammaproteobacteria bacterium]|jgi:regulatory protein
MRLLSIREHSFNELERKLNKNDDCQDDVLTVIEQLRDEDLQSDGRFTEAYIHSRLQRGFGPVRIRQELRERSISDELISLHLQANDAQWNEQVRQVREKKYGKLVPTSYPDKMKQSQFLQYRGFTSEQIRQIFRTDED